MTIDRNETLRRWRMCLSEEADPTHEISLSAADLAIDQTLASLYQPANRKGGLGNSSPKVNRWLGDIRTYFPASVVRILQRDAMDRLGLKKMLLEPEMMEAVEPDVHLVSTLVSLKEIMPTKAKATARTVIKTVLDGLLRKLDNPLRQAVQGSLRRAIRNPRPKHNEINWDRTLRANLKHYQPDYKTIIPERRIGFGRKKSSVKDIILCIDQSSSMAASVVYASVFAAVLASLPAVTTRVVAFDTAVVDLSDKMSDPVDLLFGIQLGGGTDIAQALRYCQSLIRRPGDTSLILISDLYEGGLEENLLRCASGIISARSNMITLLALSDEGAPSYDRQNAARLASLGIPAFACTPDLFPDLMAAALQKQDLSIWVAKNDPATQKT